MATELYKAKLEEDVLKIKNLSIEYRMDDAIVKAVNDVSFSIQKGHSLGLVGETGAGKTTTALAALKLVPSPVGVVTNGEVYVCGQNVYTLNKKQLTAMRGDQISMVFQDPMTSLNPVETVVDQIAESFILHKHFGKSEAQEKAFEMLEMVGISRERAFEYPHQFSGGMKQRVVIAIALACEPQLLIADEPTTALDVTIQAQVLDLMRRLKEKYGMALLLITHDLGIVADICDEVAVMYAGSIVERGTLEDVFNDTLHPYTEGLFDSLPNINNKVDELKPIPGLMPDPTKLPAGCAFASRCKYATEKCHKTKPAAKYLSDSHLVT